MNGFEKEILQFFVFLFWYISFWKRWHRRFLIILIYVVNIFSIEIWRKEDEIIKKSRIFCVTSKWIDLNFGGKEILRGYFDRFLDGIFGTWYEIYSRGWIVRKGDITGFLIISIRIVNIFLEPCLQL